MSARVGASTTVEQRLEALKFLHGRGHTLETCAGSKYLALSERTVEKYARKVGLAFPDYTPRALKPKKEKANAVPRARKPAADRRRRPGR